MDAYSLLAALENARAERGPGGIAIPWTSVSDEIGVHQSTFSRLKAGRLPGPRSLGAVMEWLEIDENDFTVGGDTSLPIGDRREPWDGEAATNRVFAWAKGDDGKYSQAKLRRAFFYIDPKANPATRGAYKLPYCDVRGGSLYIVPAAMAAVSGGHGVEAITEATPSEVISIKKKMCQIYERLTDKFDDWPDCPFNQAGERVARKDRRNDKSLNNEGDTKEQAVNEETRTAGIIGVGALSKSDDPHTQALVVRVRELLQEGAVAVSIKHDMHPDVCAALNSGADLESLPTQDLEAIRPRHVAIVDTAAFSAARLTLAEDGYAVSGPVTFEGIWTGDGRTLPYNSLTWDDDLLPIPIIWDRQDNDHDGAVVGYITSLERVDGMTTAARPERVGDDDVTAVTAAAGQAGKLSPEYFQDFKPTKAVPLTVTSEDSAGLRRVYGIVAPKGVCHRSDMGECFQYPGDVDPTHKGFHTGQILPLSDGTTVRVGALTLGGRHIDANLSRQGVGLKDVGRHRDDANTVFAMVRAWETAFGLAVSGVVMPSADRDDLFRAAASSPSVELWPSGRGRTLVGIHLVPTPAWPVAASAGGAERLTTPDHVHVADPEGGFCAECGDAYEGEPPLPDEKPGEGKPEEKDRLGGIEASLKRIESALALLAEEALTDVPLPEEPEKG